MKPIETLDGQEKKKNPNPVARLFGIGFILFFIIALIFFLFISNSAIDLQFHDTYLVVGSGQILILYAIIFGFFFLVYKYLPKLTASKLGRRFGEVHFWGTLICVLIIIHASIYLSVTGIPRRYYSFDGLDAFSYAKSVNKAITLSVLTFALFQLLFVLNCILSLFRKSPHHNS